MPNLDVTSPHHGMYAIRHIMANKTLARLPDDFEETANSEAALKERNLSLALKECNDTGNAERFLLRHGNDVIYVQDIGWHFWNGTRWDPTGAGELVRQKAQETARSIMEEIEAVQKNGDDDRFSKKNVQKLLEELFKWSISSGNRVRLEAMVREVRPYLMVPPESMDRDPYTLNLANGTLQLSGACDDLRPHRRDDYLSKIMNVAFNPDAQCPAFLQFLKEVQPDPDIRLFLQVWCGYCLTGVTSEQKLIFNYGEGGNGKSVFIDLIAKIMGPYATSLPFTSLLRDDRKRGGEATPDLARLPGARLVRASEPEKDAKFAEATIKSITGGEEITVRHLRKGFFDFVPRFKLSLSGNHKPFIRAQDRGIWRRLLLVPWLVNIPTDQQDKTLSTRLWEERSGVLNWMIDGARLWLEDGLQVPRQVQAFTDEYRTDMDPIGRFLSECVEKAPGEMVQASILYEAYYRWCRKNGEKKVSETALGRILPERGISKTIKRVRWYMDIRLVNVPEMAEEDVQYE